MSEIPERAVLGMALTPRHAQTNPLTNFFLGQWLFVMVLITWLVSIGGIWWFSGIAVWTAGLLYVTYDTCLIAHVTAQVRRYIAQRQVQHLTQHQAQHKHGALAIPHSAPSIASSNAPTIAVLIAARNEVSVLPATLNALLSQHDQPEEILVIDDGSTDLTLHMLQQRYAVVFAANESLGRSATYPNLKVLTKPNSGKADSLNQALNVTHADMVVTLDADTTVDTHAIAAMRHAFADESELAAVCGRLIPRCVPTISGRIFQWFQVFEYLRAFLARIAWMRADALLLVSGAFAGYRREVMQLIGGFDPRCLVEDYELIHRLHRYAADHGKHWRVRVVADASASTDAPATLSSFLKQRRRWFAGFLQTQYKNRDMTGNAQYGTVGRFMLPIKMIDTLQPIYGLTAFVLLVSFIVRGNSLLWPVLAVIGAKLIVDFGFQLWAVHLYYRWVGQRAAWQQWALAVLASLIEPFCFQILRHTGALLGWFAILTRQLDWIPQRSTISLRE